MKKKIITLLMMAALAETALSGCGAKEEAEALKAELKKLKTDIKKVKPTKKATKK